MIIMEKIISVLTAAAMIFGSLSTCCGVNAAENSDEKLKIVTTIFPEYDWVNNILGEDAVHAEVTLLLNNGVDLHSYQPTVDDILKISTCDLFIYVGGESDAWVDDALKEAVNPDIVVLNLLDLLGEAVREEEIVEGMQHEDHEHEDDEDGHDHGEDHEHEDGQAHDEEEAEYDEHVWLSLRNAAALTRSIAEILGQLDEDCAEKYMDNAQAYIQKLNALDEAYQNVVSKAPVKTLLFGDRFPFRYLTDDYDLTYYAAFAGCSAETEASFETITFLARKMDELSLHSVMTIEGTDHSIAETIVQNTKAGDQQILSLDSMQSTTSKDIQEGADYLSVMEKNLEVLREALK